MIIHNNFITFEDTMGIFTNIDQRLNSLINVSNKEMKLFVNLIKKKKV